MNQTEGSPHPSRRCLLPLVAAVSLEQKQRVQHAAASTAWAACEVPVPAKAELGRLDPW